MKCRILRRAAPLLAIAALAPNARSVAQPAPVASREPEPVSHRVESGETLSGIAQRYGVRVDQLMLENGIDDARRVRAGTRLRIPPRGEREPARPSASRLAPDGLSGAQLAPARDAPAAPPPTPTTRGAEIDPSALLERCEAELRAARFEQALASAVELRARLDARPLAGDREQRVRLEIASATAELALGRNDAALESMLRALRADPALELDPVLTSPRVLAIFRTARSRAASAP